MSALMSLLQHQKITGADEASLTISVSETRLTVAFRHSILAAGQTNVYLALRVGDEIGSAVLPFERGSEGSTVFLPFNADLLLCANAGAKPLVCQERRWSHWKWSERRTPTGCDVQDANGELTFDVALVLADRKLVSLVAFAKDLTCNDGWGWFFGCSDAAVAPGIGDKYIPHYWQIQPDEAGKIVVRRRGRSDSPERARIYQLFVRLFGNVNETRKPNGTLAENGVGKFNDINDAALGSFRASGFTHIWLTGVLQQATATDYSAIGQPADDPDLLKGLAGSPYAIKDYFDVCPDYAVQPERRLAEFRALLDRIHAHGLKALIDFVPNHVARSYRSDVRPDLDFGSRGNGGAGDDRSKFFSPQNNFFHLSPGSDGPPLRLPTVKDGHSVSPTCKTVAALCERRTLSPDSSDGPFDSAQGRLRPPLQRCDGFFAGEMEHGKATGNNVASWAPSLNDWYETVKLNYGFDFTDPRKFTREYPNALTPDQPAPDTWSKMDAVISHWQQIGVDGFRCDMAHMVPPEFWSWVVARARRRQPGVLFIAEAYDNDPAKVPGSDPVISRLNDGRSNVMFDLLNAGFDFVYDDPTYRALQRIYEGSGWANDIDEALANDFIFDNSLRYAENHDEVRLASQSHWAGLGMAVGRPVSAILYGLSRGAAMLYNGQEVGEPGSGAEGFGSDDARTSIFDYWSMPEMTKWANYHAFDGAALSAEQQELRSFYNRLLRLVGEPAFRAGGFFPLNRANRDNPYYGRLHDEQPSGHWLYGFLRYDRESGQQFLVLANLNSCIAMKDVRVVLSPAAVHFLNFSALAADTQLRLVDRLAEEAKPAIRTTLRETYDAGIHVPEIPPLTACYFELSGPAQAHPERRAA